MRDHGRPTATDVLGHSQPGIGDLVVTRLAAKLLRYLDGLVDAGRADWVSPSSETAR